MPKVATLHKSSMNALYYSTLLVVGPRNIPLEATISFVGEKITHVEEVTF